MEGAMMNEPTAVYVHVPFCVSKCAYCDFYSVAPADGLVQRYLDGVDGELARRDTRLRPTTVYVGGGTPTALGREPLARLLAILANRLDLSNVTEWTVEANPAAHLAETIPILVDAGGAPDQSGRAVIRRFDSAPSWARSQRRRSARSDRSCQANGA